MGLLGPRAAPRRLVASTASGSLFRFRGRVRGFDHQDRVSLGVCERFPRHLPVRGDATADHAGAQDGSL
jgi:hypothetical protein